MHKPTNQNPQTPAQRHACRNQKAQKERVKKVTKRNETRETLLTSLSIPATLASSTAAGALPAHGDAAQAALSAHWDGSVGKGRHGQDRAAAVGRTGVIAQAARSRQAEGVADVLRIVARGTREGDEAALVVRCGDGLKHLAQAAGGIKMGAGLLGLVVLLEEAHDGHVGMDVILRQGHGEVLVGGPGVWLEVLLGNGRGHLGGLLGVDQVKVARQLKVGDALDAEDLVVEEVLLMACGPAPCTPGSMRDLPFHHGRRGQRLDIMVAIVTVAVAKVAVFGRGVAVGASTQDVLVRRESGGVVVQRQLLVGEELVEAVDGAVLLGRGTSLLRLPQRRGAAGIERAAHGSGRAVVLASVALALLAVRVHGHLVDGLLARAGRALAVRAAGAGRVGQAELVGVEEQGVGIVNLQNLLLPIQSVLLLREGVDKSVAQGAGKGSVLPLSRLDLVGMRVLVFLHLALVLILPSENTC
jgi:hypothetical protein